MALSSNSRILLTGGTGSFGRNFIKLVLEKIPDLSRLVIYSRDELKQWELQQEFPESKYKNIRYFLGDVRDKNRLKIALNGINTVIHAAALKQVPAAEFNPMEFIKTNVIGAQNLIDCCLNSDVQSVVTLSSDKAAAPINLYGATKLCSDKLFIAANNIVGSQKLKFSVVRYGNVMGSRGSVIPFFIKQAEKGFLPITHEEMTRFNITLRESIQMVFWVLNNSLGGEIFVPKIPSYRITDLAEAIGPKCRKEIIGIRPGEKIHEEMITSSDSFFSYDLGDYYAIFSSDGNTKNIYEEFKKNIKPLKSGFSYNSGNNKDFLSVDQIRDLIKKNISKDFKPV